MAPKSDFLFNTFTFIFIVRTNCVKFLHAMQEIAVDFALLLN